MYLHVVDTELHPWYGSRRHSILHSILHSEDTLSVSGPGPTSSLQSCPSYQMPPMTSETKGEQCKSIHNADRSDI